MLEKSIQRHRIILMKPFKGRREHSENELELGDGWGKVTRTKCTVTSDAFSSEKASGAGLNFKNIIWYVSDQAQCMTLVFVAWLQGRDTYCINKAEESRGGEVRTATLGIHLPVSFSCHLGSQGQGQRHSAEVTGTYCNEMVYMVIPPPPTTQCMLAGDQSAISHLASGRWYCSVSLTCCLKPSDRWQLPTDAAVYFNDVREAVLWDAGSGDGASVSAEQ